MKKKNLTSIVQNMNNTGPGCDNLPKFIYKDNLSQIAAVMTRLCNLSMCGVFFFHSLSVAGVKCILKEGNAEEASYYRTYSLLPCFGNFFLRKWWGIK